MSQVGGRCFLFHFCKLFNFFFYVYVIPFQKNAVKKSLDSNGKCVGRTGFNRQARTARGSWPDLVFRGIQETGWLRTWPSGGPFGVLWERVLPTAVAEASDILLGSKSGEHTLPLAFQCLLSEATIPSSLAIHLTSCLSRRQSE